MKRPDIEALKARHGQLMRYRNKLLDLPLVYHLWPFSWLLRRWDTELDDIELLFTIHYVPHPWSF